DNGGKAKSPVNQSIGCNSTKSSQPVFQLEITFTKCGKRIIENFVLVCFPGHQIGNTGNKCAETDQDEGNTHQLDQSVVARFSGFLSFFAGGGPCGLTGLFLVWYKYRHKHR